MTINKSKCFGSRVTFVFKLNSTINVGIKVTVKTYLHIVVRATAAGYGLKYIRFNFFKLFYYLMAAAHVPTIKFNGIFRIGIDLYRKGIGLMHLKTARIKTEVKMNAIRILGNTLDIGYG
ncbi:MAG: hypothetical protein NUV52_02550 [Candidatus Roizmanbacteria bacterium]|nr:hypothetical protein [Candidatus Roizmanbacteria bacterium]